MPPEPRTEVSVPAYLLHVRLLALALADLAWQ